MKIITMNLCLRVAGLIFLLGITTGSAQVREGTAETVKLPFSEADYLAAAKDYLQQEASRPKPGAISMLLVILQDDEVPSVTQLTTWNEAQLLAGARVDESDGDLALRAHLLQMPTESHSRAASGLVRYVGHVSFQVPTKLHVDGRTSQGFNLQSQVNYSLGKKRMRVAAISASRFNDEPALGAALILVRGG